MKRLTEGQRKFELRVVPSRCGELRLSLFQTNSAKGQRGKPLVSVWGTPLQVVIGKVIEALKQCGYRATDLHPRRGEPFVLDEQRGVRLGLLFLAVKPLKKVDRMEAISEAIWGMSEEEVYYWFSKCTAKGSARRARRALRILLARE